MARHADTQPTPAGIGAGGLIPSVSIANLLQQRDAVIERVRQACALLREADAIAAAAHIGTPDRALTNLTYSRRTLLDALDSVIAHIDAGAWSHLLRESGLRSFMDAKARDEWDKQISAEKTPALSRDNIEATFATLYEQRGEMFERGVVAVFRSLSWNYKTNSPVAFGKRIIVRHVRDYGYIGSRGANSLDDLVRVFCVLDGIPEPDHRQSLYYVINDLDRRGIREWDGPYFFVRWFLNGNAHLMFKRLDLVERMNAILAKHHPGALPATRNAGSRRRAA